MKIAFSVALVLTFSVFSNSSFALTKPELFACRSSIEDKKIVYLGAVSAKSASPRAVFEDTVKNKYLKSGDYIQTVCGEIRNDAAGSAKENLMSYQRKESVSYKQQNYNVVVIPGIVDE